MAAYVGEIRMFAGNFPPIGWLFCEGQTLPISENEVLFQLIGTTYGGDGEETFRLPDLASRIPIHMGTGPDGTTYQIGEQFGVESVTLGINQIPNHTHPLMVSSSPANQSSAAGNVLAEPLSAPAYIDDTPSAAMAAGIMSPVGGSQPHENCQPFLCINFIISLFGVFPSQT